MITPHPTSRIDPLLARGVMGQPIPATATRQAHLTFLVPNTNYELHLLGAEGVQTATGKRLIGTIRVEARRIDIVQTGGQYMEPVIGRPRRMQGTIIAVRDGAVVVDAGVPVHVAPTDPRQSAEDFKPGQFVTFEVKEGAAFVVGA